MTQPRGGASIEILRPEHAKPMVAFLAVAVVCGFVFSHGLRAPDAIVSILRAGAANVVSGTSLLHEPVDGSHLSAQEARSAEPIESGAGSATVPVVGPLTPTPGPAGATSPGSPAGDGSSGGGPGTAQPGTAGPSTSGSGTPQGGGTHTGAGNGSGGSGGETGHPGHGQAEAKGAGQAKAKGHGQAKAKGHSQTNTKGHGQAKTRGTAKTRDVGATKRPGHRSTRHDAKERRPTRPAKAAQSDGRKQGSAQGPKQRQRH